MKFTDRLKKAIRLIATKDDDRPAGNWSTFAFGGLNGEHYPTPGASAYMNEYTSWVFANVDRIAKAVSVINFRLMKVGKGDKVEEVPTHEMLELLYRPNPFTTKSDFIKTLTTYLYMSGEAPIRLKRNNPLNPKETPRELSLIKPDDCIVKVGRTTDHYEILTGYEVKNPKQDYKLNPWEVVFINNINPKNPWRGVGVIETAAKTIDALNYAEDFNLNFFQNSAVPDAAFYTDQELTPEVLERLKNNLNTEYKSYKNSHKTMILEQGLKIEKLQNTAKDMDFVEQQRFMRDKLMALSGTTKSILGLVEDVNRANAEASEYIFTKYTVKPLMAQICEYLNEYLLPIFDIKGELFLTFDDPVPENTEMKLKEIETRDKVHANSINELREKFGDEPVDGGDVIYMPIALQPMGSTLRDPNAVAKEYVELKVARRKSVRYREDIIKLKNRNLRRNKLVADLKKKIEKVIYQDSVYKVKKYKSILDKKDYDKYIDTILSKAVESDSRLKNVIVKIYEKQEQQIKAKLRNKSFKNKSADDLMFNQEQVIEAGINLVTPVIEAIILEQGAEAFDLLGVETPYKLLEEARRYLESEPERFVKSMNNTAYEKVRKALAEGLTENESIPQLLKRVNEEYQFLTETQSKAVVRSEVSRAMGFAHVDAYKQSGVVEGKEWVVTKDDRLCEFCAAMPELYKKRTIQKLDEPFFKLGEEVEGIDPVTGKKNGKKMKTDYSDINHEPLHVHCRCVTIPVLTPIKVAKPQIKTTKDKNDERLSKILDKLEDDVDGQRTDRKNKENPRSVGEEV